MASEPMFVVNSGGVGCGVRYESDAAPAKNKVRFMCRHGGRIMHRPTDGKLKYVGGDTRVVSVSRDVNFAELMRSLAELFPFAGEMVLKYQMLFEDLYSLVSVRSDYDLRHMIEEYYRHQSKGTSNLHTFLFPAKSIPVEGHALEQRYVDAINGILICTPAINGMLLNAYPNNEQAVQNGMGKNKFSMSKVQSSPGLCNLGNTQNLHIQQQEHGSGSGNYQFPPARVGQDSSQKVGLPPMMNSSGFYVSQGPNYFYPSSTPPRQYGSGGSGSGDSAYNVISEMPSRARSPSPRPDGSYGMGPEMPSRTRSPSPRPDGSYGMMPEMPSRGPRLHSSHSMMRDIHSRGRSPGPKVDSSYGPMQEMPSRGWSVGPRLE